MKNMRKTLTGCILALMLVPLGTAVTMATETPQSERVVEFRDQVKATHLTSYAITGDYVPGYKGTDTFYVKNTGTKDGLVSVKIFVDSNAEDEKCLKDFLINGKKAEEWTTTDSTEGKYLLKQEPLKAGERKGIETIVELPFEAKECNRSLGKGEMNQNKFVVNHKVDFTLVEEPSKPKGRLAFTGFGSLSLILVGMGVGALGGVMFWFTKKRRNEEEQELLQEQTLDSLQKENQDLSSEQQQNQKGKQG